MSEIDIFVSPTGIITLDHMKKLKYNTYVGNTGHFDYEVDLACSEGFDGTESSTSSLRRSLSSPPLVTGPLVLQMWRFKGFFALFPDFKKSAGFGRQCGDDPPGGNFHAERSSNGSCRSRRALQLMDAGGL